MNFREWEALAGYTNSLMQGFSKGRLLRRKIIRDCDGIFISLVWVVLMSVFCWLSEMNPIYAPGILIWCRSQATPPPTLSLDLFLHKEIEDLEFDSSWVTKMRWGDAY